MSPHANLASKQWTSKLQDHFCWGPFGWTKPPSASWTFYKFTMMPCTHINLADDKLGRSMDRHQCKVVWPMHMGTCDSHMQVLPSTWGSQEIHLQPQRVCKFEKLYLIHTFDICKTYLYPRRGTCKEMRKNN
jgi:hypothetical protein